MPQTLRDRFQEAAVGPVTRSGENRRARGANPGRAGVDGGAEPLGKGGARCRWRLSLPPGVIVSGCTRLGRARSVLYTECNRSGGAGEMPRCERREVIG